MSVRLHHRLFIFFALLIMMALYFASPSVSSCGGGESGVKSIEWIPLSYKFKFNEYKGFTLKNTGTETVKITKIGTTSGAFIATDVGKCLNRIMTPGASCLVEVHCIEWEKTGSLIASAEGFAGTIASLSSKP